jgi:hypothetical protein
VDYWIIYLWSYWMGVPVKISVIFRTSQEGGDWYVPSHPITVDITILTKIIGKKNSWELVWFFIFSLFFFINNTNLIFNSGCKAQYYAMVGAFYFTKFGGAYVPLIILFTTKKTNQIVLSYIYNYLWVFLSKIGNYD